MFEFTIIYLLPFLESFLGSFVLHRFVSCFARRRWRFQLPFFLLARGILFNYPMPFRISALWAVAGISICLNLILIKIFFVIRIDKLLFTGLLYRSLSAGAEALLSSLGPFDALSVGKRIGAFMGLQGAALRPLVDFLTIVSMLSSSILSVALTAVFLFIVRKGYREPSMPLRPKELLFLTLPAIVTFLATLFSREITYATRSTSGGLPSNLFDEHAELVAMRLLLVALMLIVTITDIYVFWDIVALNRERTDRLVFKKAAENMAERLKDLVRERERERKLRHDMKNHIAVLSSLAEDIDGHEELKDYLLKIGEQTARAESTFATGSVVIDALLSAKQREIAADPADIRIDADGLVFPRELSISEYDLATLLGNALDNAIEACRRLPDGGEAPTIMLVSEMSGNMLLLTVKNPCAVSSLTTDAAGFPVTDKGEKEAHGMGLRIMRAVAESYQGALRFEAAEGSFTLNAMLQNNLSPKETVSAVLD